ncbi:hypothetical protein CCO03_10750 [Comamonas serinivorans]|uniref:DUF218 domain-containing protein n=1 Tax=Comamonas serinivorans TaxID=1082851 RepID=A0A1Y0EN86_9BURK|nr:YdcF family protein [Comamonas serinivorans]ARU05104.1 hypothetical protein CCO03_10750 [Comamonas serinivorans]
MSASPSPSTTSPWPRRAVRWLACLLLALALWVAAVAASIWRYAGLHDPQAADAIVVLGAAVQGHGPSPVFAARIDHGVQLYQRGVAPLLVFTGGSSGQGLSEAQVAQQHALAQGVPPAVMRVETQSRTTADNLRLAKPLLQAAGAQRILLVSDPLHMRRAVTLARRLGLDAHPAPTPHTRYVGLWRKTQFLARETWFQALLLLGLHT